MEYNTVASRDAITKVIEGLKERNVEGIFVSSRADALEKIKSLIPEGASVMNGSSRTLEEIGYVDYLKGGTHGWNNLHANVLAEKDPEKQKLLRKQSVVSDYYLGSVHGLAETGEFIVASNTGSQLPHVVFTSQNVIFVVGAQKIVPTLTDAFDRLEKYVLPLEDENMMGKYKMRSQISKVVVFRKEGTIVGRKILLIIVNEKLGF